MKLSLKKAVAAGAAVALGLGIAGLSSTAAVAAPLSDSVDSLYLYDVDADGIVASGSPLTYESFVLGVPNTTDPETLFTDAPAGATEIAVFLAPRGQETNLSAWNSSFPTVFAPGERSIRQAPLSLWNFPAHSFEAVRAAGGDYSLGYAYVANNGVTFVGLASFVHVSITAGTAAWTYQQNTKAAPVDPTQQGEIGVEATVAAPVDGDFSLSVPAAAKATLGAPAWVDNKSTSTGVLPTFAVTDERRASQPGWDVTTSVANFTRSGGVETIEATNLRIAPKTIEAGTTSTGVAAAAAFQGSGIASPFASAAAGSGLGVTNLSADLTFAAPTGSAEGTYTSKVTVTVVSK